MTNKLMESDTIIHYYNRVEMVEKIYLSKEDLRDNPFREWKLKTNAAVDLPFKYTDDQTTTPSQAS